MSAAAGDRAVGGTSGERAVGGTSSERAVKAVSAAARPAPGRAGRGERGSASVLVLAVAAVVLVLAATLALVVQGTAARARAQASADLAAVSAARAAQRAAFHHAGAGEPCVVAAMVAERNGATMTACEETAGGEVTVGVVVETVAGRARATARAAPRR